MRNWYAYAIATSMPIDSQPIYYLQAAVNAIMEKNKGKELRTHPAISLVSHGLRDFNGAESSIEWEWITLTKIRALCRSRKKANADWHPHLFDVPLNSYITNLPVKKKWWLALASVNTPESQDGRLDIRHS